VNHKSRNLIVKDVMNNSFEQLQAAEQALIQIFSVIDAQVKQNLKRVLRRSVIIVWTHHFSLLVMVMMIWVVRLWIRYLRR